MVCPPLHSSRQNGRPPSPSTGSNPHQQTINNYHPSQIQVSRTNMSLASTPCCPIKETSKMDPVDSPSLDQHMSNMRLRDSNSDGSLLTNGTQIYHPQAVLQCPQSGYTISLNLSSPPGCRMGSQMPNSYRTPPSKRLTPATKRTTIAPVKHLVKART